MDIKPIQDLINEHLKRYPAIGLMDVYRLLHQGTFGVGHRIANPASERDWLMHQWEITPAEKRQPMMERISPAGDWVRLYLSPYIAADGSPDQLVERFVESSTIRTGTPDELEARWGTFVQMIEANKRLQKQFPLWEARRYGDAREEDEWSAVQHSPLYYREYPLATVYRVMHRNAAEQLLATQHIKP